MTADVAVNGLRERLATEIGLAIRAVHEDRQMEPGAEELFVADALLPIVEAHVAAQVAAELERLARIYDNKAAACTEFRRNGHS